MMSVTIRHSTTSTISVKIILCMMLICSIQWIDWLRVIDDGTALAWSGAAAAGGWAAAHFTFHISHFTFHTSHSTFQLIHPYTSIYFKTRIMSTWHVHIVLIVCYMCMLYVANSISSCTYSETLWCSHECLCTWSIITIWISTAIWKSIIGITHCIWFCMGIRVYGISRYVSCV